MERLLQLWDKASPYLVTFAFRLIGAIALWVIGGMAISAIKSLLGKAVGSKFDHTLIRYLQSIVGVALKVLLAVVILGVFGVETTSFAAIFAAAGVAIGMAWSGLLANFAAGVFLLIFRPFKAGDMITAGGHTGVVREIGLFATTLDTADNIATFIGNNKIFSDSIQNYSANSYRRIDLGMQLAHGVSPELVKASLQKRLAMIPHVLANPPPDVEILEFNELGTKLAVRPYTHNVNYWNVYFAVQNAITAEAAAHSLPTPSVVRTMVHPKP